MLSLVSVYNDASKLAARLKAGLARQTSAYQLIDVENCTGRFRSAAAALNYGAEQAAGDWVVFLHQDVELLGHDWLERAERFLHQIDPNGWHGVVGRTRRGRWRGLLRDRDMVFGEPLDEPVVVQTLDEVVLIHRNRGRGYPYFDEGLLGWHGYGVDVCCQAIRNGARNFVLPLPIWHDSTSTNLAGLRQAHAYLWAKHASAFREIYTTCGVLPHPYGWSGSYKISTLLRRLSDWWHFSWMCRADRDRFQRTPWEVLEELTINESIVHCYHRPFAAKQLVGAGFQDRARVRRQVVHHFTGFPEPSEMTGCVVIAPDLAPDVRQSWVVPQGVQRLLIASYLHESRSAAGWECTLGRDFRCHLATEQDGMRWVILEINVRGGGATAQSIATTNCKVNQA